MLSKWGRVARWCRSATPPRRPSHTRIPTPSATTTSAATRSSPTSGPSSKYVMFIPNVIIVALTVTLHFIMYFIFILQGLEVSPGNLARALAAVEPALWAPPTRPATLSLNMPQPCTNPINGNFFMIYQVYYLVTSKYKSKVKNKRSLTLFS